MSKPATGGPRISPADVKRLEVHLRTVLKCPSVALDVPTHRGASVELRVSGEVVGTVDQVDEEGERYWAITIVVLEDELPADKAGVQTGTEKPKQVAVPVTRARASKK